MASFVQGGRGWYEAASLKKKTVRGGLGSKCLFQRPSPPGPSQAFARLSPASAGLAPCITPLPNSQDANMNPRQLKRKVRDMEAQALKLTDKVIELEVVLKNKNETMDKHLKRIRLLNEKNSDQLLQMCAPLEPCLQLERSRKKTP